MGEYLKNHKVTVNGTIYQNAEVKAANFVTYGGNVGNSYNLPISDVNTTGGAYILLSDDATMAENFSDCCKLGDNGELVITDIDKFGQKALSGVPLSSNSGVYQIKVEVPINSNNISCPSVNNSSCYLAYGVPGGHLLSGEPEAVMSSVNASKFLKKGITAEGETYYEFAKDFSFTDSSGITISVRKIS